MLNPYHTKFKNVYEKTKNPTPKHNEKLEDLIGKCGDTKAYLHESCVASVFMVYFVLRVFFVSVLF